MSKPRKDRIREERIRNEAVVDAYGPEEQAMGWYYYLENKMRFLFQAKCIASMVVSPLRKGEPSNSGAWRPKRPMRATCSRLGEPQSGSSPVSPRRGRVNHRGHRRLALLNSSRLRFLNRARLISFSEVGPTCRPWFRQSLAKRPAAASRSARLNRDLLLDSENSRNFSVLRER